MGKSADGTYEYDAAKFLLAFLYVAPFWMGCESRFGRGSREIVSVLSRIGESASTTYRKQSCNERREPNESEMFGLQYVLEVISMDNKSL